MRLALGPDERHAGLTVNEYETLLMQHDLAEVLREPAALHGREGLRMLARPARDPAQDAGLRQVRPGADAFNRVVDALGRERVASSSALLARVLARAGVALPADEALGEPAGVRPGRPRAAAESREGTYQSPILVQWGKASAKQREVEVILTRFK